MRRLVAVQPRPVAKVALAKATAPKDPRWLSLHRMADARVKDVKRSFLTAVASTQDEMVMAQVSEALARGDLAAAEGLINWTTFAAEMAAIQQVALELVREAGKLTAEDLSEESGIKLTFDLLNPRAVEHLQTHGAELVTQVTEETKAAIRSILQAGFEAGEGVDQLAKKVRAYIGLTQRQAQAVENLYARLVAEGKAPGWIEGQAEAYRQRLLDYRAEMIARTETISAASEGQREAWRQAVDGGLVTGEEYERVWIVTPDDRLCDECAGMENQRAPIDGTYQGEIKGPPLHPSCRCAEGLVRRGG